MFISVILTLEFLAVLGIIAWMIKKRIASRGDIPEPDEEKRVRKMENVLDLPNEERWE